MAGRMKAEISTELTEQIKWQVRFLLLMHPYKRQKPLRVSLFWDDSLLWDSPRLATV